MSLRPTWVTERHYPVGTVRGGGRIEKVARKDRKETIISVFKTLCIKDYVRCITNPNTYLLDAFLFDFSGFDFLILFTKKN